MEDDLQRRMKQVEELTRDISAAAFRFDPEDELVVIARGSDPYTVIVGFLAALSRALGIEVVPESLSMLGVACAKYFEIVYGAEHAKPVD